MRLAHADLGGKPHELDGVLPGGAGAAVVAAYGDDVRPGLDDAKRNGRHPRHGRDLHRDAGRRVRRAQLLDDLGQVLDGVDVVVVGGGDQGDPGGGVSGRGDLRRHLEAGEVPPLAGLRPLPDLDLQDVGGVQVLHGDPEAPRGYLLPPVVPVAA